MRARKSIKQESTAEREKRIVNAVLSNEKLMEEVRQALKDESDGKGVPSSELKRKSARR